MIARRSSARLAIGILAVACSSGASAQLVENVDWPKYMSRHDMVWDSLPQEYQTRVYDWSNGPFTGNGVMGAMIATCKDSSGLKWELGLNEATNHRPEKGFNGEGAIGSNTGRIMVGNLKLDCNGPVTKGSMRLDLWNAEVRGTLRTNNGDVQFRTYTHATKKAIVVDLDPSAFAKDIAWVWTAAAPSGCCYRNTEPDPPAFTESEPDNIHVSVQPLLKGGQLVVAWKDTLLMSGHRVLYASVSESYPSTTARADAVAAVRDAIATGTDALLQTHRAWWHDYYKASFVSVPDTRLESFYWIQLYKIASATRPKSVVLDLTGPWHTRTMWPMVWWNLNVQLQYSPQCVSNHPEFSQSLTANMDANFENLCLNVPNNPGNQMAAIGRTSGYSMRSQVGNEWGNLTWAMHNYFMQYRATMDDARLRDHLFPLLKRCINFYLSKLYTGDDGKLHLPKSSSPELALVPDCNYDLSALRWGLQTLVWIDNRLGLNDPLRPKWDSTLTNLVPFPADSTGFMVGAGRPWHDRHTTFSHLLMIYPFQIVNWDQVENRSLILTSVNNWLKTAAMEGFSLAGASSMCASMGDGDRAYQYLQQLAFKTIKPNTMFVPYGGPCMEAPLAGAKSFLDMLLISRNERILVFPALPREWNDVSFVNLRADGAFLVSATRRNGITQFVTIKSLAGEKCVVKTDLPRPLTAVANRSTTITDNTDGTVRIDVRSGETVTLVTTGTNPRIGPYEVPPQRGKCHCFGLLGGGANCRECEDSSLGKR